MLSQGELNGVWSVYVFKLSTISTLALFIFDCILIFPREVELIWNRKIGLAGVLYFVTRFTLGLFLFIMLCANLSIFSVKTCTPFVIAAEYLLLVAQLSRQEILIIRAYAISNRNRYVVVGLTSVAIGAVVPGFIDLEEAGITCATTTTGTTNLQHLEILIASALTVAFDVALIVITLYYTVGVRPGGFFEGITSDTKSLMSLLVQQGILHFLFAVTINIALMVTDELPPAVYYALLYHSFVVGTGLISRFFLDLREVNAHLNGIAFTQTQPYLTGFLAVAQRTCDVMIEELGNSFLTRSARDENLENDATTHDTADDTPSVDLDNSVAFSQTASGERFQVISKGPHRCSFSCP